MHHALIQELPCLSGKCCAKCVQHGKYTFSSRNIFGCIFERGVVTFKGMEVCSHYHCYYFVAVSVDFIIIINNIIMLLVVLWLFCNQYCNCVIPVVVDAIIALLLLLVLLSFYYHYYDDGYPYYYHYCHHYPYPYYYQ